jgi:hypothetical protein
MSTATSSANQALKVQNFSIPVAKNLHFDTKMEQIGPNLKEGVNDCRNDPSEF